MRIIYNGIDLQVLELVEAVCEPVYDESKTDLLYTRYHLSANVMVNGEADVRQEEGSPLSLTTDGGAVDHYEMQIDTRPPGVPQPAAGSVPVSKNLDGLGVTTYGISSARVRANSNRLEIVTRPAAGPTAVTLRLLQSRLNEPRGQLWVFSGDGGPNELVVRSHDFGQYCDCKNGPKPIALGVTRAFGDGETYFLNFQVETYVDLRERYRNEGELPLLLSNRFSTTHSVDADSYLTIDVAGEAHCRTDVLYDKGLSLDSVRKSLFLPVPLNHVRGNIVVRGSEDGSSVQYRYTDKQVPVNFVAGRYVNATQIEAVHRQSLGNGKDLFNTALDTYNRVTQMRLNSKWLRDEAPAGGKGAEDLASKMKTAWFGGKKKP